MFWYSWSVSSLSENDKCKSCVEFDSGNNPDFKMIEPDGKTIKIEQIWCS